jgi:hypothetical protein
MGVANHTKPESERRVIQTFSLHPATLRAINALSQARGEARGVLLDRLVAREAKARHKALERAQS